MNVGRNVLRTAKGIAMIRAIVVAFCSGVRFRIAFRERDRASAMTTKNQVFIAIFHLYFIRIDMSAKASAKDRIIERIVGSVCVVDSSSPNGSGRFVYSFNMKSPMNWVNRNMDRSIRVVLMLCFILLFRVGGI